MTKSIVISERDNIAAVVEEGKVVEFFIHRGDILLGDIYLSSVENILPSIDAAFVNVGSDKMGFLHASDISGKGALKDKLKPKQPLLVQVVKEPTGNKGPRVTTSISLPGRFLVFMPDEKGISISRKITSAKERARLKSVVSLIKPTGVGVIIRTEAEGQSEAEIQEDLELLLEKWANITTSADTVTPPNLLYRDQDLLYRVIREACNEEVKEIIVDTPFAYHRTNQLFQNWNIGSDINVSVYKGNDPLLVAKGIDKEIRNALQTKVNMPSGGYLYIQTTEALTVIDVNSGKFVSSATQSETIRKTNSEAVQEIARQLRLRNIGGMIIIDFIDMENRVDKLAILCELELALEPDKSKPQVGQLSDLGLVELTRHRQGQSLAEIFTKKCPACSGNGVVMEEFNFASPSNEADFRLRSASKLKMPNGLNKNRTGNGNQQQKNQQAQDIVKKLNDENRGTERKINTFPSIAAKNIQRKAKTEKTNAAAENLTDDGIKQFFDKKGFVPNVSKNIRFSAVPPKVAREHLRGNMDVFSVLQEIESGESTAKEQNTNEKILNKGNIQNNSAVQEKIEQRVEEAASQTKVQQHVLEKQIEIRQQREITAIQNNQPQKVERPVEPAVQQQIADMPEENMAEKSVKPEEPKKTIKTPARRGRKPKAEGAKTTTVRRRTTKAAAKEEE